MKPFIGSAIIGWRAVLRANSFRWCALGGIALATLSGCFFAGFLVFEDKHTRVELVASTLHLWTVVCICLVVPPRLVAIARRRGEEGGVFDPNIMFLDVAVRGLGVFAAYAMTTAALAVAGWIGISASGGQAPGLLHVTAAELLFGGILLSGAIAVSQIGTALATTCVTVGWLLLGTAKHLGDPGPLRWAVAWVPDFALLQPTVDSDTSVWTIAYGGLLIALYIAAGATLARIRSARRPARL